MRSITHYLLEVNLPKDARDLFKRKEKFITLPNGDRCRIVDKSEQKSEVENLTNVLDLFDNNCLAYNSKTKKYHTYNTTDKVVYGQYDSIDQYTNRSRK